MKEWLIICAILLSVLHVPVSVTSVLFLVGFLLTAWEYAHKKKLHAAWSIVPLLLLAIPFLHIPKANTQRGIPYLFMILVGTIAISWILAGVQMVKMRAVPRKKKRSKEKKSSL